jgi:hypothetical protein
MKPVTNNGRAHFYAAEKVLFGKTIDTVWFNIAVIWLSTILLYILLLFNGLKRLVDFLSGLSLFPKAGKKRKQMINHLLPVKILNYCL